MDTITTIQNLTKLNGSAQSVMVKLTPKDNRLIAAAPELLSMLKTVYSYVNDPRFTDRAGLGDRIKAVITRATGDA